MSNSFFSDPSLEPKRAYRFLLYLGGIPTWLVKSSSKPSYAVSETKHQYLNHTFFYPGRVEWEEMKCTLIDPVQPDSSKTMLDILISSGYHFPTDPRDVSTISKSKAVSALGRVVLTQIDPDGNFVEEWELINAWVKSVTPNELNYESEDMTLMDIVIRFDYAQRLDSTSGVLIQQQ